MKKTRPKMEKRVVPLNFFCDRCQEPFKHEPYKGINTIRCPKCNVYITQLVINPEKIQYTYERVH